MTSRFLLLGLFLAAACDDSSTTPDDAGTEDGGDSSSGNAADGICDAKAQFEGRCDERSDEVVETRRQACLAEFGSYPHLSDYLDSRYVSASLDCYDAEPCVADDAIVCVQFGVYASILDLTFDELQSMLDAETLDENAINTAANTDERVVACRDKAIECGVETNSDGFELCHNTAILNSAGVEVLTDCLAEACDAYEACASEALGIDLVATE